VSATEASRKSGAPIQPIDSNIGHKADAKRCNVPG